MLKYEIIGMPNCSGCERSKMILNMYNIEYDYFDAIENDYAADKMAENGFRSVPQIWRVTESGKEYVGQYDQLFLDVKKRVS